MFRVRKHMENITRLSSSLSFFSSTDSTAGESNRVTFRTETINKRPKKNPGHEGRSDECSENGNRWIVTSGKVIKLHF